ncbi:MAG TPA: helix-turn-helix transcriptional regulator [Actinomycetales bacterium]|nr:helix-turn-helix transcriptional regulator [Actinomycetales bacterium]
MPAGFDHDAPVFVISVAAQLAGMHPQTLRQYDRLGLVSPSRSSGRGRRYSARDISQLREVQRLSQEEGVNLAGIKQILDLELQVEALRAKVAELREELEQTRRVAGLRGDGAGRVFAAGPRGDVVAVEAGRRPARSSFNQSSLSRALVVWRPQRRQPPIL